MEDHVHYGNRVLYHMCEEKPRHTDEDVVHGKIWLIGRAYSVAVERGSGKHRNLDTFYKNVARKVAHSDLDEWLDCVADINVVSLENLPRVLAVHARFVHLLKKLTGRKRPSFASKYLHFHRPSAFFIYDKRARDEIRKRIRRKFKIPADCTERDTGYADFVVRCIHYTSGDERPWTPRELDRELLRY